MEVADLGEGHGSHHIFMIKRSPHRREKILFEAGLPYYLRPM